MLRNFIKNYYPWFFVCAFIAFIFSNSMATGTSSGSLSGEITAFIMSLLNRCHITVDFDTLHHFVRKGAHFSEYAVLALFVSYAIHHKPLCTPLINFIIFMIFVPSSDETIQLFIPGRAGMITDVLIDMSGYLFGGLFALLVYRLYRHLTHAGS